MKFVALLLLAAFTLALVPSANAAEEARTFLAPRQKVTQKVVQNDVTPVQKVAPTQKRVVQKQVVVQKEVAVRPAFRKTVDVKVERTGRRWRIWRPFCRSCNVSRSVSRSVTVER